MEYDEATPGTDDIAGGIYKNLDPLHVNQGNISIL